MSVPDDAHVEICPAVRERLRWLELAERKAIVDGLYEALPVKCTPIRLPQLPFDLYPCVVLGYCFYYRTLEPGELKHTRRDRGYRVLLMKPPRWISARFGW